MVRQAVLVDAVLAAVLTALAVDTVVRTGADSWLAHLLAVLMVAPVAVRQRAPVLATGIMGVAMAAYGLLGYSNGAVGGTGRSGGGLQMRPQPQITCSMQRWLS